MKFRAIDGQEYIVSGSSITPESATALIEAMRLDSHNPGNSLEEFMHQVAQRCLTQKGCTIATDSPDNFIKQLTAFGFFEVLREDEIRERIPASPHSFAAGAQTPWGVATRDIALGDTIIYVEKRRS